MRLFKSKPPRAPELIRLPNGDWINPTNVLAIRLVECSGNVKPGVVVDMGNIAYIRMYAATDADAEALREEVAKSVGLQ